MKQPSILPLIAMIAIACSLSPASAGIMYLNQNIRVWGLDTEYQSRGYPTSTWDVTVTTPKALNLYNLSSLNLGTNELKIVGSGYGYYDDDYNIDTPNRFGDAYLSATIRFGVDLTEEYQFDVTYYGAYNSNQSLHQAFTSIYDETANTFAQLDIFHSMELVQGHTYRLDYRLLPPGGPYSGNFFTDGYISYRMFNTSVPELNAGLQVVCIVLTGAVGWTIYRRKHNPHHARQ